MIIKAVKKVIDPITDELGCYTITFENSNRSLLVPLDENNSDFQAIQEWSKIEGNTIEEAD